MKIRGLLVFCALLATLWGCGGSQSVAEVEDSIRNGNPIGSRRDDVESFLRLHKIKYEISRTDGKDVIKGIARNVSLQNPVRVDLQLTFTFGDQGRLKDLRTKQLFTGP